MADEYLIPLGIDASGIQQGSQQTVNWLKAIGDAAKENQSALQGVFTTARTANQDMSASIGELIAIEKQNLQVTQTMASYLSAYTQRTKENTTVVRENTAAAAQQAQSEKTTTTAITENTAAVDQNTAAHKKNQQAVSDTSKPAQSAKKEWNGLQAAVNQLTRELPSAAVGINTFFLAISNNLPMLGDELKRINAENKALSESGQKGVPVWKQLAGAFFSWNTALSVGITILTLYGAKIWDWITGADKAREKAEALKKSQEELNKAYTSSLQNSAKEVMQLRELVATAANVNLQMDVRLSAVKQMKGQYPALLKNYSDEDLLNQQFAKTLETKLIPQLWAAAKARALNSKADTLASQDIDNVNKASEALQNLWQARNRYNIAVSATQKAAKDGVGIGMQGYADDEARALKKMEDAQKDYNASLNVVVKGRLEANKLMKEAQKEQDAAGSATVSSSYIKDQENQNKQLENLRKKQAVEAEKARKDELAAQENFVNAVNRMQKQAAEDDVKSIQDESARAVAVENNRFVQQLRDAKKFYDDSIAYQEEHNKNVEDRKDKEAQLTEAYNRVIENANTKHQAALAQIDADGFAKEQERIQRYNREVLQIQDNQREMEIASEQEKWERLREQMDKEGNLTADLEKQITEARNKAIAQINTKYDQKSLDQQHEIDSAMDDAFQSSSMTTEQLQKEKRENQLKIDISYYEQSLALAKAALAADPTNKDLEVQLAKMTAAIANAKKELEDSISTPLGSDPVDAWLKGLGLTDPQIAGVKDALKKLKSAMDETLSGLSDLFGQQADEIQEKIDDIDDQLSDAQSELEKQQELQEKGYANNVEAAEAEVARLKALRAENQKDLEAAQKKQQAAQKAQLILDGTVQAVNLITASTDIYKYLAKLGPIGVALATATIAAMFSAFAIAKVNAWKSIEDGSGYTNTATTGTTSSYAKGGVAKGKRHSQGGNKYRSMDGNDADIIEIEQGEYV
ncbi:MAG: hypothetical protein QM610_06190, partial [Chitinophagaceae bacterium]